VAALFGSLKLMQMYGREHDAVADAMATLTDALHAAAAGESEAAVTVAGGRLFVNGERMRSADCGQLAVGYLVDEWARRGIETVHFPAAVTVAALTAFVGSFLELDVEAPKPAERLAAALAAKGISDIAVDAREERAVEPVVLEERRESAMRSYLRGLRAFRQVLRRGGVQDRLKIRRARLAVQGLVDRFLEEEAAVLALAQIRGHDVRLFNHSLNVCLYALAIGQRLGLSRRQLGELGLAALFHDLGKIGPHEPAKAPGEQWLALRDHPIRGARALFQTGSTHESMLKAAIVAYEHHAHLDRSGFPKMEHEQHLFSRIVAIADCYESLTTTRAYRQTPYSSADAFALMLTKAGTLFDPLLLKVFINAVGTYPVGSVVRLDTGEVAMVIAGPADPGNVDRPSVRVLRPEKGALPADTKVDLAERDADGRYLRSIAEVMPAEQVFENVGAFVRAI